MSQADAILLSAAVKSILDSYNIHEHKRIKQIHATYRFDDRMHEYVPDITIEFNSGTSDA